MKLRHSPVALALLAAGVLAPLAVQAAPSVSITSPASGATVSGTISSTACEAIASASGGVKRVRFFIDSKATPLGGSDSSSPYRCTLDTTQLANGSHKLIARAWDNDGVSRATSIAINVQNGTGGGGTSTPAPEAGPLDVWFKAPADGATISGTLGGGTNCYVKGIGVTKVQFFVNDTSVGTDTSMADGMQCQLNTTQFQNGTYQLKAKAWDASGATRLDVISVNIANSTGGGGGTGTGENGLKSVSTFHSIGLYWTPPSSPGAAGCTVQYRKQGETAYKPGFAMWYDSRNKECRGSLVELDPGSSYDIQVGMPGQAPAATITAKTWDEQFPIAKTITVDSKTGTLNVTESGTATGYVLYQAAPGAVIDGGSAAQAINVDASYVIVRGFTVKGGANGIQIQPGRHDVVVEQNDVSGWGRLNNTNSAGWKIGVDEDSGITAKCYSAAGAYRMIVQRNKVHDPRYGANSWDWGHPAGPTGISFYECGDNNVIRYNEVTSSNQQHYYNDAIGGGNNDSKKGSPGADSDIYGNIAANSMDDGIEAEGGGRNVRVWGNYVDVAAVGIATTPVSVGPIYVFRNVYNRSRQLYLKPTDSDERNNAFKSGSWSGFGDGRRYVFHNTVLQQKATDGSQYTLGAAGGISASGSNEPLTNTVSRNNILHVFKDWWSTFAAPASGNDLDYDLYNGGNEVGGQAHGKVGVPVYATGNGWQSGSGGMYQLAPTSPGYGAGVALPNFNNKYAKPDMGAHQSGAPAMKFGVAQ
jgi:hypothetical protein